MLKQWIILLLALSVTLSACQAPVYNQTQGNVADVKERAVAARHKSDRDALKPKSLVVKQDAYIDTSPMDVSKDPAWVHTHVVMRGDQLPFSYYSRAIASGAPVPVLTKLQNGLDASLSIDMNYSGPIKGALDVLAARTGYTYSIQGNTIYWQAYITKTFDIAFMPGGTDYLMGKQGGTQSGANGVNGASGGGGIAQNYVTSDSSDAEYSSLSAKLSVWKDVESSVKQMLSPQGSVTISQATTSVTVRDRPGHVALVEQYINNLNKRLSKQVLIKVQILEVTLSNAYNMGLDWQLIGRAFHNSPFVINGNYGTPVSISQVFSSQSGIGANSAPTYPQFGTQAQSTAIPSWTILLNALSQQGKTSIVTEPRVVCLNNQVSVIRIVESEGYVASVQNTSLASTSSTSLNTVTSQITPGTVVTGLTLYLLPKILNNNIYMQVNADLSSNQGLQLFTTGSGSNSSSVQLPNVTEKHFNQRSVIRSGDTLILSGFRQVYNQANANQFLKSQALGGVGSNQTNTETIILITPILLSGMV